MSNIDQQEINKFSELAEQWWDKNGDFKPLHVINPLRANYIKDKVNLQGMNVLDVGCGLGDYLRYNLKAYGSDINEKLIKSHSKKTAHLFMEIFPIRIFLIN